MAAVIYSALIGGYERPVPQPDFTSIGLESIMFTDNPSSFEGSGWRVIKVDPRFPRDPVRSARYLKTVGHPELDDYDQTIWADNRVVLKDDAISLLAHLESSDLVLFRHSYRDTVRDEYEEVIASGYDDPGRVRATFDLSLAAGVDPSAPPLWTGLLLRRRSREVAECMRMWMDYILVGSRRDQLSINAALSQVPLAVRVLDIDNSASAFHSWIPVRNMVRKRAVQAWRPERKPISIRLSDAARRFETTRRAARLLERAGYPLPTLGERPSASAVGR